MINDSSPDVNVKVKTQLLAGINEAMGSNLTYEEFDQSEEMVPIFYPIAR